MTCTSAQSIQTVWRRSDGDIKIIGSSKATIRRAHIASSGTISPRHTRVLLNSPAVWALRLIHGAQGPDVQTMRRTLVWIVAVPLVAAIGLSISLVARHAGTA